MPFEKGNKFGNRKGRPKGATGKVKTSQLEKLLEALTKMGEEEKEEFMHRVARLAYHDVTMTKEVLKKMVADRNYLTEKQEGDGSIREPIIFETIETHWSAREAMVDNNKEGILFILNKIHSHEFDVTAGLEALREELLKESPEGEE